MSAVRTDSGGHSRDDISDPVAIPRAVRLRRSLLVVSVGLYAPYSWLLWTDYPLSDYRWFWIKLWPVLPGVVPTMFLESMFQRFFDFTMRSDGDEIVIVISSVVATSFVAALTWFGMRSRRSLAVAAAVAIVVSVPCAFFTYAIYRA